MLKNVTGVFWWSIVLCFTFVLIGAIMPEQLEAWTGDAKKYITNAFGWYYMIAVALILVFCIYLMFSKFGKVKLGKEGETPEFGLASWFAMLFGAGMGIGIVFWTTAEPISHAFKMAPGGQTGTDEAVKDSLQYSFLHWGLHAWAIYGIVGLILAYFKFHKKYPGLISATLVPLFGIKAMKGIYGKIIDILAAFATIVGVAAALGFGSAQINQGLSYLFDVAVEYKVQLTLLLLTSGLFMLSAWSGIQKGIKFLSNINMFIGVFLLILLFIVGPTVYILDMFTSTLGNYISGFVNMSFQMVPLNEDKREWINSWTLFYWAWWISWSPFVGVFIARISRGRTIREFMLGVLFVPSIICFIFFSVFGVSALHVQQQELAEVANLAIETTTFGMLEAYPLGAFMSMLTLIVSLVFFISSADSATFVLGMLTTNGSINPPSLVKLLWGMMVAAMAAILVYFGGTQGIQNTLILAGLPFSFVLLCMMLSFYKELKSMVHPQPKTSKQAS